MADHASMEKVSGAPLVHKCHSLWDTEIKPQWQALYTAGNTRSQVQGAAGDPVAFSVFTARREAAARAAQTVMDVQPPVHATAQTSPAGVLARGTYLKTLELFFFRCR